ncbi:MAG: folylpolyglutamate synthase/dihydrofolate synthase family protein [Euryarchaeota archaeon]|nr:folylpolyglutamate synthase/dihydrofolate synthase family protein [Euryarchaeota archaeon]
MYKEFIEYLYTYRGVPDLKLESIRNLLEILDNPQNEFKSIHIAGTNGKGSTAAMITQMLMEEGYTAGLYTSPHLIDFRERIQIGRNWIPKEDVLRIGKRILDIVEDGNPASFFEITTAMMFTYFAERKIDYGVIEVGLGGRLDATNVISPELSVITHISLDHTDILGDTIEAIAYEKAGIIKKAPSVISDYHLYGFFSKICKERGSKLYAVGKDLKYEKRGDQFDVSGLVTLKDLKRSLRGDHQLLNAATASLASHVLGISERSMREGLKKTQWAGRFEILRREPLIVFDGAHNPGGVKTVVSTIKTFDYENLYIIFGVLEDKNYEGMIETLKELNGEFIFTKPNGERALDPEKLTALTEGTVIEDSAKALETAKKKTKKRDAILVTGSLYLVGDMKAYSI